MKLMRLFTSTELVPKRFENPVDVSLMRRIDEQRERLRLRGVEVTPLLRVRKGPAAERRPICDHATVGSASVG